MTDSALTELFNDVFDFQRVPKCSSKHPNAATETLLEFLKADHSSSSSAATCGEQRDDSKGEWSVRSERTRLWWLPFQSAPPTQMAGNGGDASGSAKAVWASIQRCAEPHDTPSEQRHVAVWVGAHAFAFVFSSLPTRFAGHVSGGRVQVAVLSIPVDNEVVVKHASIVQHFPSYPPWAVPVAHVTPAWVACVCDLAEQQLPCTQPTRTKGGKTYVEERAAVQPGPAIAALLSQLSPPATRCEVQAGTDTFATIRKTLHTVVQWDDEKLERRRSWSWLGCKSVLRFM